MDSLRLALLFANANFAAMMRTDTPPYEYKSIIQAAELPLGVMINLWAVVLDCSIPRQTRGTDMVCNLNLSDPSIIDLPDWAGGVEMLCFGRDFQQLPHLNKAGDIIRLHRVKVEQYNGHLQLVGKLGNRGFAYCLFSAQAPSGTDPYQPYLTSSERFSFSERDHRLLDTLRQYMATLNQCQLGGSTAYMRRIKDVRPQQFFDIICQVLAVDDSHPSFQLMYLWDGTDALPFPAACDTRQEEDGGEPQPELRQLQPFALPYQDLPTMQGLPALGTALPMVIPAANTVERPAIGSWVKFRNLGARVVQGQLQAFYFRNSRWTPWQHEAQPQQQFTEEYQQRLASGLVAGWAPSPDSGAAELLATCTQRHRPLTSLRQVLMDTPLARPRCYRVLVRLLDYEPKDPAAMCHPAADCGMPADGNPQRGSAAGSCEASWVYTLKLLVEDSTAALDVVLFGPDAQTFFQGLEAASVASSAAACAALQQRLQRLLGEGCQREGGPWMELGIKSYYLDPGRPWETRQYRVYDTTLQASTLTGEP